MKCFTNLLVVVLIVVFSMPTDLVAAPQKGLDERHVVSPDQLRAAVATKTHERAANIEEIQKLLRHDEVRKHIKGLADLEKIERAVPTLDDATLARLAGESRAANDQIQAGSAVKWIVVAAIAVAVVFIIICAAYEGCFGG